MAPRLTWVTGLWGELATGKIFKDNCCFTCICFTSKSYSRSGLVYKVSWDLLTVIQLSQKKAVAVGLTLRDGLSNYSVFLRRDLFRAHLFSIDCYWNWLRIISEKASNIAFDEFGKGFSYRRQWKSVLTKADDSKSKERTLIVLCQYVGQNWKQQKTIKSKGWLMVHTIVNF